MVSDTGGIDDHAFNENAWKGMTDAQAKLGVEVKFLESTTEADYAKNINQFVSEGCDMIVTVGFLLGDATKVAAEANPDVRFAIVDFAYDPAIPNVEGLVYTTNEAAMLAGYASAAWSKTARHGHLRRDQHRRSGHRLHGRPRRRRPLLRQAEGHHDARSSVGIRSRRKARSPATSTSIDDGKTISLGFLDENADVCLGVGGPIGQGCFAAIEERGATAVGLGVDVDWYDSVPQYKSLILTSILKKIDVSVTRPSSARSTVKPAAAGLRQHARQRRRGLRVVPRLRLADLGRHQGRARCPAGGDHRRVGEAGRLLRRPVARDSPPTRLQRSAVRQRAPPTAVISGTISTLPRGWAADEAGAPRDHQAIPRRHREPGRQPDRRAGRDPRAARRERRRQDDADERPATGSTSRTRARS